MRISRKDFLKAGAAIAGSSLVVIACGDDGDGGTAGPTTTQTSGGANNTGPVTVGGGSTGTSNGGSMPCTACVNVSAPTIAGNHGHGFVVSVDDVNNAADMTYDMTGSSGHSHDATVTAADFMTLQTCGTVMVSSTSGGGHTHNITISCTG